MYTRHRLIVFSSVDEGWNRLRASPVDKFGSWLLLVARVTHRSVPANYACLGMFIDQLPKEEISDDLTVWMLAFCPTSFQTAFPRLSRWFTCNFCYFGGGQAGEPDESGPPPLLKFKSDLILKYL